MKTHPVLYIYFTVFIQLVYHAKNCKIVFVYACTQTIPDRKYDPFIMRIFQYYMREKVGGRRFYYIVYRH